MSNGAPTNTPKTPDPERLKKLLEKAGIKPVSYEQYAHPDFYTSLGMNGDAPQKDGKTSVLVIETLKEPGFPDIDRHGEYAATIANAYADRLSGKNISVIFAPTEAQMLGNMTLEEWDARQEAEKEGLPLPPIASNQSENIAKKRAVFANTDVVSISQGGNDRNMTYEGPQTKRAKNAWQGVNSIIAIAAGNNGGEEGKELSELLHDYRNYRMLPQDSTAINHFAHYSILVGAAAQGKNETPQLAEYSTHNGVTFVATPPAGDGKGNDTRYKFINTEVLEEYIQKSKESHYIPSHDIAQRVVAVKETREYTNIDGGYQNLGYLPKMLDRAAKELHELQPEGEKENETEIRARHQTGMEEYLFKMVKKEVAEEYQKDTEEKPTYITLPNNVPDDALLKKAVNQAVRTGSLESLKLDEWTHLAVDAAIDLHAEEYITNSKNDDNRIPGSFGHEVETWLVQKREKELREEYAKEIDTKGYSKNLSGTSFAAPIVAGQIAALKEKHPEAMNEDVLWALAATAKPVYEIEGGRQPALHYQENAAGLAYNDTHAGFGMTDFKAADALLQNTPTPPVATKEVESDGAYMSDNRVDGREYTVNIPESINATKVTLELQFHDVTDQKMKLQNGAGEVILVSPTGDEVMLGYLANKRYSAVSSNLFLNTDAKGDWKIRVPNGEFLDNAKITVQGIEPDARLARRPPEREPLRETDDINRMAEIYKPTQGAKSKYELSQEKREKEEAEKKEKEQTTPEMKAPDLEEAIKKAQNRTPASNASPLLNYDLAAPQTPPPSGANTTRSR